MKNNSKAAKGQQAKAKKGKVKQPRQRAYVGQSAATVALRKWISLLGDPCNADLTAPCYGGSGTGYYTRQVQTITPPADAVDYLLEFNPTATNDQVFTYGYSATAGGSLGTVGATAIFGLVTSSAVQRRRCIAACMQVQYKGSELNRSGLVSSICVPGRELVYLEAIAGNASDWSNSMNHHSRVGEHFEYLWIPGEGDQEFLANTYGDTKSLNSTLGNSLQLLLRNIPPGTVEVRVITCWEWQPTQEGTSLPWSAAPVKAPPAVPFQTALASIGDLAKFAVKKIGENAPMVASVATRALRTVPPALALM
jgi:hypothetical protein